VLVSAASATAFGDDDTLVGGLEIMDELACILIVKRCADWDLQNSGVTVEAGTVGAHTVLAALAFVFRVVAKVDEGVVALRAFHDNVTTAPAVSAGRTAAGDEFLAAEGHAAIAAVASFDTNFCFIDEHGWTRDQNLGTRDLGTREFRLSYAGGVETLAPSIQFTESGLQSFASSNLERLSRRDWGSSWSSAVHWPDLPNRAGR
jgi:hypothetical protein